MLLVEDGRDAREILTGMLELRFPQMTLHLADNGKTGLDTFREHLPAWVITDLNMPVMSGIRLAEEVKIIASEVKPSCSPRSTTNRYWNPARPRGSGSTITS